jgi:hypothetical protein
MIERSRVLTGRWQDGAWRLRLRRPTAGGRAWVEVDWAWALEREEARGDVVGFYHTHPGMAAVPSARDVVTMRAWVSCFGKPLLCAIEGKGGLRTYLFISDEDDGRLLPRCERRGGWLEVGMEGPADERAIHP